MAAGTTPDYDFHELMDKEITELIDASIVNDILCKKPFIPVPVVLNLRDLGVHGAPHIRRNRVYRSGGVHNLSDDSKNTLKNDLGITLILNMRSQTETRTLPEPDIFDVTIVRLPSTRTPQPVDPLDFAGECGTNGYVKMNVEIIEFHIPSIQAALEQHLRDRKGAILFHYTAGKDRTGVLAAVIMGLAGCPQDVIAHDYALTRISIEPHREALLGMPMQWNKNWTRETPGMHEFSQVKGSNMKAVLKMVEEKHGGMEGYAKKDLGFTDEEVENIKTNLKDRRRDGSFGREHIPLGASRANHAAVLDSGSPPQRVTT